MPSAQSLPHLPFEILRQISGHLDTKTATSLARTCKVLRNAGELKVWETLFLTSGFTPPDLVNATAQDWESRRSTVHNAAVSCSASFTSYPFRSECVRQLLIEPSDYLAEPLLDLTRKVITTLQSLVIIPLPLLSTDGEPVLEAPGYDHTQFWEGLVQRISLFPQLKMLRVQLTAGSVESLRQLAGVMPRLERLDIEQVENDGTWLKRKDPWPLLPSLTFLNFAHQEEGYAELFSAVLQSAPNLSTLMIQGNWAPYKSAPAVQAMRNHPGIRSVIWMCDDIELGHVASGAMSGVKEIVQQTFWLDETDEMSLDELYLPRMSGVKRFCAMTGPRQSPTAYASLGVERKEKPDQTRRIPGPLIRKLARTPSLTQIQYVSDNHTDTFANIFEPSSSTGPPLILTLPSDWESHGSRGMLIRTYTSPMAEGDLYHLRLLTRATSDSDHGLPYVGARRQWHELVAYMNKIVPFETLVKVYELLGERWDWTEGGRGKSMPREAWTLLDDWAEVTDASEWGPEDDDDEDMSTDEDDDEGYDDHGMDTESVNSWVTEGSGVSMD